MLVLLNYFYDGARNARRKTGKDEGGAIIVNEDEESFSVCSEPTEHTGEILDNVEIEEELYWKTTCCICYEKFAVEVKTKCNHKFCSSCVTQIYHGARNDGKALQCPYCRGDLTNEILDYEFTLHNNLAELSTDTIQNTFPTLTLCSNVTIDDVLKWLECPGIDINHMNVFTALTSAATKGNLDVLNVLIANGADVESTTMVGETPLMMAASYGHVELVEALLQAKAKVNAQNNGGFSALHYATANITIVDLLFEYGANINIKSISYVTPIFTAASFKRLERLDVVEFLIEKKVDINVTTKFGQTPLMAAARNGHFGIVQALLQEKAEVNAQMIDGFSALHFAAESGHLKIVQELLKQNPRHSVLKQTSDGRSALSLAKSYGHTLITKLLYEISEIADVQNEDEISSCVNKIFTNLYEHAALEDDHDIEKF